MFLGTHQRTLDDKGRLSLPSSFRDLLTQNCIITRLADGKALGIYPEDEFAATVQRLRNKILDGEATQDDLRRFAGNAEQVKIDNQGRVTIPSALRDQLSMGRDVTVAGVIDRFEVWEPAAYEAMQAGESTTGNFQ